MVHTGDGVDSIGIVCSDGSSFGVSPSIGGGSAAYTNSCSGYTGVNVVAGNVYVTQLDPYNSNSDCDGSDYGKGIFGKITRHNPRFHSHIFIY